MAVFVFDSENHLVSMNNGAVTLLYDGDGKRVSKTMNGVTTRYLVDDLNPTGYPQVVEEISGGVVQREYTYGLQRIGQNQVISGAWTPSFFGSDGFGSVRQLTNLSGGGTDTYEYGSSTPEPLRTFTCIAASSSTRTWAYTISVPATTTRSQEGSCPEIHGQETHLIQRHYKNTYMWVAIL